MPCDTLRFNGRNDIETKPMIVCHAAGLAPKVPENEWIVNLDLPR